MNEYEGWGTALKPAHEPIVMARKPLEGTNIDNVLKYGTGGINIDGCRIQGDDTGGERKITTRKSRDENNVWTDENSGMKQEKITLQMQTQRVDIQQMLCMMDYKKMWARYFYCPKTSVKVRNRGLENFTAKPM